MTAPPPLVIQHALGGYQVAMMGRIVAQYVGPDMNAAFSSAAGFAVRCMIETGLQVKDMTGRLDHDEMARVVAALRDELDADKPA